MFMLHDIIDCICNKFYVMQCSPLLGCQVILSLRHGDTNVLSIVVDWRALIFKFKITD